MSAQPALHAFVRTGLPRLVQAGEASYWVRPPTVEEALQVLALMPSAMTGDADDAAVMRRVLTTWIGLRLSGFILDAAADPESRVGLVRHLLGEGLPEGKKGDGDGDRKPQPIDRIRWDLLVLDVARVFSWTLRDVLEMAWPRFMLVCARLDAVEARAQLRQVPVTVLPHSKDAGDMIDRMRARAAGAEEEEKDAEVEEMEAQVGRAYTRAHFGPPPKREEAMKEFIALEKELAEMKRQRGLG